MTLLLALNTTAVLRLAATGLAAGAQVGFIAPAPQALINRPLTRSRRELDASDIFTIQNVGSVEFTTSHSPAVQDLRDRC